MLTKVCNANHYDWDLKIPVVLWAYHTTCKWITCQTPFKLAYRKEEAIPMEYIIPSLCISMAMGMDDAESLE